MPKLKEKVLRVIKFSGKIDEWIKWSVKLLARSNKKGYKKLANGPVLIPSETQYQTAVLMDNPTPIGTKCVELYKRNQ